MQTTNLIQQFNQRQKRADSRFILLLVGFLLVIMLFALSAGEIWLWPTSWSSDTAQLFVWNIRLPRVLAVMTVGAGLAVTGAVMQALFENPLAEPGLLGISNGAGVAVVFIVLFYHGIAPYWLLSLGAIAGALLLTFILLFFARRKHFSNTSLLLVGVALGVICGAIMTWMVYLSSSLDLRQLLYWMMGSFSGVDWRQSWMLIASIPCLLGLILQGRVLNYLSLGDIQAYQLGVSSYYWRLILIVMSGILIGLSVAIAGAISFVGLVVPHLLRLAGVTDNRMLLPACALAGAAGLLLADILSRLLLSNAEIPIGVITATLGVPLFIGLLIRNNHWR
ncbi:vitamin B12 ABC transporter permease BtuC [Moellerella wisconsensis]|uniref:Vitamin B12 import system permease protein BtuC n=1 Tax=Moellerella wisconsensis TaxID=158849 RepID=A0A9Q8Q2P7_9GAMM|nr:vitamin B12 ABC transporter permease BtuC [Moellerella wisconsensis]UNH31989.1 vitamin B12 ABC transporter permease BtuC [Moellerella wisconsensis]